MTKIIEAIKFTGTNLNDIFKLECVDSVTKDCNGDLVVFLSVLLSTVQIGKARAERDQACKQLYVMQQKMDSLEVIE